MVMGVPESKGVANSTWNRTVRCISEALREVLGVSRGNFGEHRGNWWCNGEVQRKVEVGKVVYVKWVEAGTRRIRGRRGNNIRW